MNDESMAGWMNECMINQLMDGKIDEWMQTSMDGLMIERFNE